jgi:hypothetical protein
MLGIQDQPQQYHSKQHWNIDLLQDRPVPPGYNSSCSGSQARWTSPVRSFVGTSRYEVEGNCWLIVRRIAL